MSTGTYTNTLNGAQLQEMHYTELVKYFPSKLKQAIVAAAKHNLLKRADWNGCVFNAAGRELGHEIKSSATGALVFGISSSMVYFFISSWDSTSSELSDIEANKELIQAIIDVGLFTEPGRTSAIRGYVVKHVFKSELDKLNEEFQAMSENIDLSRPISVQSELEKNVCELVSAL